MEDTIGNKYIKNQKDPGGSKYLCAQDEEDFKQEKLIQEWLKREGRTDEFECQHINRKGTARNTLVRAQVRLDAKIQDDESGTFADLIAGCDGRDLDMRIELSEIAGLAEKILLVVRDDMTRRSVMEIYRAYLMECA